MQEFDVFYYHSPITYTLTKLIIDQEKKAFYCEIGGRGIHHPGTIQIVDDGVWDIEKTVQFFKMIADIFNVGQKPLHLHLPHTAFLMGKIIKFTDQVSSYSYLEEGVFSRTKINHIINDSDVDAEKLDALLEQENLYHLLGISKSMILNINKIVNYYYDFDHPKYNKSYCLTQNAFDGVKNKHHFMIDLPQEREIHFKKTILVIMPPIVQIVLAFEEHWHLAIHNLLDLIENETKGYQKTGFKVVLKTHPQDADLKRTNHVFSLMFERFEKHGQFFERLVFPKNLDKNLEPALLGFEKYMVIGSSSALHYLKILVKPECFKHIDLKEVIKI